MSAKTYDDKWKCPKGHSNTTMRRIGTAGKKVASFCCRIGCLKRYTVVAGPLPKEKA